MLKNKKIQINSSLTELFKVEEFVETISDVYNINNNYYSTILMSLDEAVRNAIEHGNNFDIKKKVTISFKTDKGNLIFSVKDSGAGFKLSVIPDPTNPDYDISQETGKGLFLMKHLSDDLSINAKGNEVSLHFKVSSINKELALQRTSALKSFFQGSKQIVKA
ncbi:MAG: ATP-binding protein [Bacteroidales bacterium]|jgi:serine/threonine-protein kinase RsbW|nr:ATP-binding protein [Bacteroidales bacterium]